MFVSYNHILMFYKILILFSVVHLSLSFEPLQCQQKTVPNNVLSSFRDSIANLQTGTLKVQNSNINSRYTSFNVTIGSGIIKNYTVTISVQNIHEFVPKNGIDFQVTAVKQESWFVGYLVMDVEAQWGWVSVSYVISGRSDFSVGNFIADNNLLIGPTSNNSEIQIQHIIPSPQKVTGSYLYTVPYVGGMRTFDQQLSLKFIDSSFNASTNCLKLSLLTQYAKYPLQFLSVSYLVFSMASELQITSIYNIYFIPSSINTFLGVSSVSSSSSLFNRTVSPAVKPLLSSSPTQIQAFEEMFGIDGIIVQTQQSIDVLYLPIPGMSTTLNCISKTTCSNYGGFMIYEQSKIYQISSYCKICPKNSQYNISLAQCQCSLGFTDANGTCINISLTCKENQVYNPKTLSCICAPLFVNRSGTCVPIFEVCPPGQIYFQGICIKVMISQNPACPQGFLMVNATCQKIVTCSPPLILNSDKNICECPKNTSLVNGLCQKCSTNQTETNSGCMCKDGYFRIGPNCLKCSANAYYDGSKCICLRLYTGDGFTCTLASSNLQTVLAAQAPSGSFLSAGIVPLSHGA